MGIGSQIALGVIISSIAFLIAGLMAVLEMAITRKREFKQDPEGDMPPRSDGIWDVVGAVGVVTREPVRPNNLALSMAKEVLFLENRKGE